MFYQKCLGCNSEWNGIIELENCPFCQKEFEIQKENFNDIEAAFKYILKKHGFDVIKTNRLISLLSDYAPTLTKERKIVKIAIEAGVYKKLLDVDSSDNEAQEYAIAKAIDKLNNEMLLDLNWSKNAVIWLISQLNWSSIGATENNDQVKTLSPIIVTDGQLITKGGQSVDATENSLAVSDKIGHLFVNDIIYLGKYPFYKDGTKKDIEWEILSINDGKVLLWSTMCIDAFCYHNRRTKIIWEKSALRSWLEFFIRMSFEPEETSCMLQTKVKTSHNFSGPNPIDNGPNTEDIVFILSKEEISNYNIKQDKLRAKATPYALSKNVHINYYNGNAFWWLRNPGTSGDTAMVVGANGCIDENGNYVNLNNGGIRPAVWADYGTLVNLLDKK